MCTCPSAATRGAPASWTAADVMGGVSLVLPETAVQSFGKVEKQRNAGVPGWDAERLIGIMNAQQLTAAMESGRPSDAISSFLDVGIVHAQRDHPSPLVGCTSKEETRASRCIP